MISDADLAETRRLAEAARDATHVVDPAKAPCPSCLAIHRLEVWCTPDRVLALLDHLTDERARRQDVEQHERNLLARIHRDGGHYTDQHGIEASRDEAHRVIAVWIAEHDELPRLRARLEAAEELAKAAAACPYMEHAPRGFPGKVVVSMQWFTHLDAARERWERTKE